MSLFQMLVFLLFIAGISASHASHELQKQSSCQQPWTVKSDKRNGTCVCGDSLKGVVYCDPNTLEVSVLIYHCMTYNEAEKEVYVGHCYFNYFAKPYYSNQTYMHTKINTDNASQLNHVMCHSYLDTETKEKINLHRTGQMCGSCEEGYAPPVYSYNVTCVECSDYKYNWLKYIAVAFLPLTVFYIIVVLFRITATSAAMNGYVFASQIAMGPTTVRFISLGRGKNYLLLRIFTVIYGIWNLDFFRDLYTPFCLHPKMTTLQALALDYLVAVYPLVLIIITYIFVKLHDRYSIVVRLWSPFYWCFSRIRKKWNIGNSLIGAFATFLLLSYVKILYVSFDLLAPNVIYDVNGKRYPKFFLYYDGTYEYFGKDHLPYAFLALFMLFVFNIIPLVLLCLYPCRCFHRCLNKFWPQREVFCTFAETFNGCYSLEPHDCRYIAAFYLLLRFITLITYAITPGPAYFPLIAITFFIALLIVATVGPYDCRLYTFIDSFFILLIGIEFLWEPVYTAIQTLEPAKIRAIRRLIWVVAIPPLYGIIRLLYYFLPTKCKIMIVHCWTQIRQEQDEEDEEELPSSLYEARNTYTESSKLLSNTKQ